MSVSTDFVRFRIGDRVLFGKIRSKNKLLDWTLVDGADGKRYLIADEEFVDKDFVNPPDEEFVDKDFVNPPVEVYHEENDSEQQAVQVRKKRGRPRKKK